MADALDRTVARELQSTGVTLNAPVVDILPGEFPDDHKARCLALMIERGNRNENIWTGEKLSEHDSTVDDD